MRKFLALGALALCVLVSVDVPRIDAGNAGIHWKSYDLPIRTRTVTGDPNDQGYIDSTVVNFGATAAIDTTIEFAPPDLATGFVDSTFVIAVEVIAASAMASGETLYVALEGGSPNTTFTPTLFAGNTTTPGTGRAGGFAAAASITGQTAGGTVRFNGKWSGSGTSAGVVSGAQNTIYGGWYGWPSLRVKVLTDITVVPVANTYRVRLWYPSTTTE